VNDAAPVFEPGYAALAPDEAPGASAYVFPFAASRLLLTQEAALPTAAALSTLCCELGAPLRTFRFGALSGRPCLMRVWPDAAAPARFIVGDFRRLWGQWPQAWLAAFVRARQLAAWCLDNRHCGACGQAMDLHATEIACVCTACGHKVYPRVSPVAIGIVVKGGEILLGRSPHFAPGMFSALAGFVEAGESVEECLCREIREEAGIEIRNLRYFGSQSWPYPHSLMIGFIADYASGEPVAQEDEIEALGWFALDRLPGLPHPGSLAARMIAAVRASWVDKTPFA
jgi:NAD+ diphosphatase